MTDNKEDDIDWKLTTFDGARREALHRWAQLPLETIIAALEEMQQLNTMFGHEQSNAKNLIQETSADYGNNTAPEPESSE